MLCCVCITQRLTSYIQWRALATDDSRFAMKIQQVALEGRSVHPSMIVSSICLVVAMLHIHTRGSHTYCAAIIKMYKRRFEVIQFYIRGLEYFEFALSGKGTLSALRNPDIPTLPFIYMFSRVNLSGTVANEKVIFTVTLHRLFLCLCNAIAIIGGDFRSDAIVTSPGVCQLIGDYFSMCCTARLFFMCLA